MSIKQGNVWRFLSSIKLAIWLISVIAALSLIGTLIPQNQEPAFYVEKYGSSGYNALLTAGLTDVYASWWFILFLALFSLNLTVCLLNRFSLKSRSLGTLICHVSILVILAGALIGMLFGQKGYMRIEKGQEASSFISQNKQVNLGFSIRLNDFLYSESLNPKEKLLVYCDKKDDCCKKAGLSQTDADRELISEISTEIGVESEISDTGYKVRVLRYLPDFTMDTSTKEATSRSAKANNPAIEVEIKGKDGAKEVFWVFARFPDVHQKKIGNFDFVYYWVGRQPDDFVSKITVTKGGEDVMSRDIRVNYPLQFAGYSFFQSGYDAEHLNWTGLRVVKDPGVGLVYSGFGLLILGLCARFYVSPFMGTSRK